MRRGLIAGLAVFVLAPVASAAAADADATRKPATGNLTSDLHTLSSAAVRDASAADQALALSLPLRGPGSLMRQGDNVVVQVVTNGRTPDRLAGLEAAGAEILDVTPRYDAVTVSVLPADLRQLAAAPGVEVVEEVQQPMTGSSGDGSAADAGAINACATGVVSEGNSQLNAGTARTQFDVDGGGVKVGILSDSYDNKTTASTHAAGDVSTGDLPGPGNPCGRTEPVQVIQEAPTEQGDEGRAMLQIVHDIAPGASLAFATAFISDTSFAANIRALADSGAKVIADDIIYFNEPFFQDGVIANAVTDVTSRGVAYFSMAFNDNIVSGGNDVASFEAPAFRQSGAGCPAGLPAYVTQCMDFNPAPATNDSTYGITIPNGATVRLDLQWNQPLGGVTTDLDAYLVGTGLGTAPRSENVNVGTTRRPFEFLSYQNTSGATQNIGLVVNRYVGAGGGDTASPRLKVIFTQNGTQTIVPNEYTVSSGGDIVGPSIFGHNGTAAAQTVAAVPFNNSSTVEAFSSRGPVTLYFGPVSDTATLTAPAAPLGAPLILNKPDVAATDRGITTFFGSSNRFSGTSAATPHAAAVGALQLSANSALNQDQVKQAQKATARAVGVFGPNAAGAGLVDAQAAIASQPTPPPTVTVTARPTTTNDITPTFEFTTTGRTASVTCTVDGFTQPCASPFTYDNSPLSDGPHAVSINATDFFGQTTQADASYTQDTRGPAAPKFTKGPKKKTKSKKAKFEFSSEPGSTFLCSLDNKPFSTCSSPTKVRVKKAKPKPKKHTFEVEAVDALGNVGQAATYRWKVVKKKRRR